MKFGVREICDVVLKAKANQKIGNKIFYKHEPVIYFDTLKTSSMEGAATTVYAQGGRGNSRLIAWEGERTVTFTMEDALISPAGFMILSGAGLIEASEDTPIHVHTTEQTNAVTVTGDAVTIELAEAPYFVKDGEDYIYVMLMEDGEVVSEPYIPSEVNGKVITLKAGDDLTEKSMDELLDCEKPLADCIASGKTAEYLAGKDICDIAALAPIMKPSEVDVVVRKKAETADVRDLAELLPFLGQALCDELAEKHWREKGIGALYEFLPFISGSLRETIAAAEFEKHGLRHFEELAPFLGKDRLRAFAETAIKKEGIRAIAPIAPFLGKDFLAKYVREMYL